MDNKAALPQMGWQLIPWPTPVCSAVRQEPEWSQGPDSRVFPQALQVLEWCLPSLPQVFQAAGLSGRDLPQPLLCSTNWDVNLLSLFPLLYVFVSADELILYCYFWPRCRPLKSCSCQWSMDRRLSNAAAPGCVGFSPLRCCQVGYWEKSRWVDCWWLLGLESSTAYMLGYSEQ